MKFSIFKVFAVSLMFSFLFIQASYADSGWIYSDHENNLFHFNWMSAQSASRVDLRQEKDVFVRSFMEAYKDFTIEQLGIKDKLSFLNSAFDDVEAELVSGKTHVASVRLDGKVVAFISFKKTEQADQLYISQLAIDPRYWKHGLGRQLVFSILSIYPNTRSLVTIPRRINQVAKSFYLKLGFKESDYMHPGYDPKKYVGYEWSRSINR